MVSSVQVSWLKFCINFLFVSSCYLLRTHHYQQMYLYVEFKIPQRWQGTLLPSGLNVVRKTLTFRRNWARRAVLLAAWFWWRYDPQKSQAFSKLHSIRTQNTALFKNVHAIACGLNSVYNVSVKSAKGSVVTGYRLDGRVWFAVEARDFSRPHGTQAGSTAHPAS
jgi:hypothetical protein